MENDLLTTPPLLNEFVMWNYIDLKIIWSEVMKASRSRIFDFDMQYNREVGSTSVVVHSTSTVVPRLSLVSCMVKSDEVLDKHMEYSKTQLSDSGIKLILVRLFASSFIRSQGNSAIGHPKAPQWSTG